MSSKCGSDRQLSPEESLKEASEALHATGARLSKGDGCQGGGPQAVQPTAPWYKV